MAPGEAGEAAAEVRADATISDIAPQLVSGEGPLVVLDAGGRRIGSLDRSRALATLAGGA